MIELNQEKRLRNSLLISLALHVTIFALPSANFRLLFPLKKTRLIEVHILKLIAPAPPRERLSQTEPSQFSKVVFEKTEVINSVRNNPPQADAIPLVQTSQGVNKMSSSIPEPTDISPERIVDFQGYPPEAVRAIFKRYGLKYERYTPELDRLKTTSMINTFTFKGNQLGSSQKNSPVTFAGKPSPGSMVLVIPPKVSLAILEAEREELKKRGLPLTTPLRKVVFGIGRDEQGSYGFTVSELIVKEYENP